MKKKRQSSSCTETQLTAFYGFHVKLNNPYKPKQNEKTKTQYKNTANKNSFRKICFDFENEKNTKCKQSYAMKRKRKKNR